MTTQIDELGSQPKTEPRSSELKYDQTNLSAIINDFSHDLSIRIDALNKYCSKEGNDNTIELLNKFGMMYEISGTKLLKQYLFAICEKSDINAFLKTIPAKALQNHNPKDEIGYKAINMVYPLLDDKCGTPYRLELIKLLMQHSNFKENSRKFFCDMINDEKLSCDYRYKTILSLENEELPEEAKNYFIKESCLEFIKNKLNKLSYIILACQNLINKCKLNKEEKDNVEKVLLDIAENVNVEYNTRADATDILLQSANLDTRKKANVIIKALGQVDKNDKTLYGNAQNVHTKEVEESVAEILEFLHSFDVLKVNGKAITVDYVIECINKLVEVQAETNEAQAIERKEAVELSLNRIVMDRALYSSYNCNLSHVLVRIWTYIVGHDSRIEMERRLIEELVDMSGTCSSGFVARLVNTISGFGDLSIRISWRDQIISNLSGRLNTVIRNMDNLLLQGKVLAEMTLQVDDYERRKHFLKFMRANILDIYNEMYLEFKQYMDDIDFELHFRSAISMYEMGEVLK